MIRDSSHKILDCSVRIHVCCAHCLHHLVTLKPHFHDLRNRRLHCLSQHHRARRRVDRRRCARAARRRSRRCRGRSGGRRRGRRGRYGLGRRVGGGLSSGLRLRLVDHDHKHVGLRHAILAKRLSLLEHLALVDHLAHRRAGVELFFNLGLKTPVTRARVHTSVSQSTNALRNPASTARRPAQHTHHAGAQGAPAFFPTP
jgi:hypothetical protein